MSSEAIERAATEAFYVEAYPGLSFSEASAVGIEEAAGPARAWLRVLDRILASAERRAALIEALGLTEWRADPTSLHYESDSCRFADGDGFACVRVFAFPSEEE